jgi:nitroreductase/Pyruvate/2-oxoacid:ferredoxin oxidoreductase delta subunit
MTFLEIDAATCTRCGACIAACGSTIIIPQANGVPSLFPGAQKFCMRCGHCVAVCPTGSLTHLEMPPEACLTIDPNLAVTYPQVSQLIKSRRSIREFQDKPVPVEWIEQIIETARYAPTGHNLQEVRWLVSAGREANQRLTEIGLEWCRSLAGGESPRAVEMQGILRMQSLGVNLFLRDAPALVVAFAEQNNPIAPTDCAIALSSFDLAANSAGLGCFWNGYFTACAQSFPPMAAALAIPEGCMPYGALCVGFPSFKYRRIPPRKPAAIRYL